VSSLLGVNVGVVKSKGPVRMGLNLKLQVLRIFSFFSKKAEEFDE
jgi:hypothetical protein